MKKLFAAVLALALAATPVYATEGNTTSKLKGDVNGDGVVDNTDAALVLKYDAGQLLDFPNNSYEAEISDEDSEALAQAYLEWCGNVPDDYLADGVKVTWYIGNYNGLDVAFFTAVQDVSPAERLEEVAGYYLYFSDSQEAYVNKDGEFYTIKQAYENGYITKEDVYAIGAKLGMSADPNSTAVILKGSIGDVNGDLAADNTDAALILKYDAGIIDSL